jgi:hypothetical protein
VPIPESQLTTWSNPTADISSATAYNSVKTALTSPNSKLANVSYDLFLQGSYRNATNIRGDSDVDIVVVLNSVFARDVSVLDQYQQNLQSAAFPPATYRWHDFRRDVLQTLESYYGKQRVKPLQKCIQVNTGPGRITADVIPAIEFWKYDYFYGAGVEHHVEGVKFFDSAGNAIINFPKQHIENGQAKNALGRTNGWYKGTVRMFKNARNKLIDTGQIPENCAPSYCVECLIYNAPDSCFGGNYGDTYCAVVNYLWKAQLNSYMSQNGIIPLIGTLQTQWNGDSAVAYLSGLRELWNSWS